MFWNNGKIPDNALIVNKNELDDLLSILRYWYGIEVDHWMRSEASFYSVILKIYNLPKNQAKPLADCFFNAVEKAGELNKSVLPRDKEILHLKGYADFLDVQISCVKDETKKRNAYIIELHKLVESCKIHYPVKNWIHLIEEKKCLSCSIELTLLFKTFGSEQVKNILHFQLVPSDENQLAITGFKSSKKVFDNFLFLRDGLMILREFDERIKEKHQKGRRPIYFDPGKPDWFILECVDEAEALILDGINQTLNHESFHRDNLVEFKMEEVDIPGLITYLKAGLPQEIFISER